MAEITKSVNGTSVTAAFRPNGLIHFSCGPRGRDGQAIWNTHSREWVKCKFEVGTLFKEFIKAAFSL
jgi:hypothetical protein